MFTTILASIIIVVVHSQPNSVSSPCYCTMQYEPVCCGGSTYSNICVAGCNGNKWTASQCSEGRCPSTTTSGDNSDTSTSQSDSGKTQCYCSMKYDPVCCDYKTYSNQCVAGCTDSGYTSSQCSKGRCTTTTNTDTTEEAGVCCDGPKHYNSQRDATSAGAKECFTYYSIARCLDGCPSCDRQIDVCCASDHKKYSSDSEAHEKGAYECTAYFSTERCFFCNSRKCSPLTAPEAAGFTFDEEAATNDDSASGASGLGSAASVLLVVVIVLVILLSVSVFLWLRARKQSHSKASYVAFGTQIDQKL